MTNQTKLTGIDLAWHGDKNPTAVAIGSLDSACLVVDTVIPAIYGISEVLNILKNIESLAGIAIDAPLIIQNETGQRVCEKEIGVAYGSRKASCHTSNKKLYPNANSVNISNKLSDLGFAHMTGVKWQIECYPHPAIIEIFGLKERLQYKKGRVSEKKAGQIELGNLICSLSSSSVVKLKCTETVCKYTDSIYIESLSGQALKSNEDALDSIICLYIAALYSKGGLGQSFGNIQGGYIWVPQHVCI